MTAFSDFPCPEEWPTFLPADLMGEYLEMYAERFDLTKFIKFNRIITSISPLMNGNAEHTGKWVLIVENSKKRGVELKRRDGPLDLNCITSSLENIEDKNLRGKRHIFDKVIVATGHHWKPNFPEFEGMELFQGTTMHSNSYVSFYLSFNF